VTTPNQAPPGPGAAAPPVAGPPVIAPPVAGPPAVAGPAAVGPVVNHQVTSYTHLFGMPVIVLHQIGPVVAGDTDRNQLRALLALPAPSADQMGEATRLSTRLRLCAAPAPAAVREEKKQPSIDRKAQQFDQDVLGRAAYQSPIPALTVPATSSKDTGTAKVTGDHVFNDPFQAVV
jgi:hypothetical protein